jgi:ABC-type branched-subunit amino acid transport system ATPase component
MLRVESLQKSFGGFTAVCDISLNVEVGKIVSLIGPNGAGESTLFKLITGHLRPPRPSPTVAESSTPSLFRSSGTRKGPSPTPSPWRSRPAPAGSTASRAPRVWTCPR